MEEAAATPPKERLEPRSVAVNLPIHLGFSHGFAS